METMLQNMIMRINLIPRLYDATEGEVLVDGVNVKDYSIEALREQMKQDVSFGREFLR